MLSHWVERVGMILAPDEKILAQRGQKQQPQTDEDFWQILAPDPKFQPPPAPPSGAFPNLMDQNDVGEVCVECEHCHRSTRLPPTIVSSMRNATSSTTSPIQSSPAGVFTTNRVSFETPSPRNQFSTTKSNFSNTPRGSDKKREATESLVLTATKDTAMVFGSPLNMPTQNFFTLCANTKELKPKKYQSIAKALASNPSLLKERSRGLGNSCPDGYTLLMAAAHSNHVKAATVIMEAARASGQTASVIDARTFLGLSSLHIASKFGSLDMVDFLVPFYNDQSLQEEPTIDESNIEAPSGVPKTVEPRQSKMPVDLLGRTPLGAGILSPEAKKVHRQLKSKLLTANDESIYGDFVPYDERMWSITFEGDDVDENGRHRGITYGIGDMPGIRIEMEDSICMAPLSTNVDASISDCLAPSYFVIGVCDGHGDNRAVSDFVARSIPPFLRECIGPTMPPFSESQSENEVTPHWAAIWNSAAMKVDDSLRTKGIPGGSTGVFALISRDAIVVANVGDSRCILIQAAPEASDLGEQGEQEVAVKASPHELISVSLSVDHKPNLPGEIARIENAGMTVEIKEIPGENGTIDTVARVCKSDTDKLSVSRAFGDFEYKENTSLGPHEQAISCEPDVVVHKRDMDRDLYLVLCCDGIFDVMTNDKVKDFVMEQVQNQTSNGGEVVLPQVADALCRKCFDLGSQDNMSVVIVSLQSDNLPSPRKALTFTSP